MSFPYFSHRSHSFSQQVFIQWNGHADLQLNLAMQAQNARYTASVYPTNTVSGAATGGKGKKLTPPYGWTSKNYATER